MPLSVVYAGTPPFAVPTLQALIRSPHRVEGVLTQPDRPAGRGRALAMSAVKRLSLAHGLTVLEPSTLKESAAVEAIGALKPDVIVVVAYGLLLPKDVLGIPRFGCINVHGSLLPRWRGAAPVQRAILAGDADTGVAIMRMDAGLDTGPVYASERVAIGARASAEGLSAELSEVGARLLVATLERLESGRAEPVPQATTGVTYAHKLAKDEAPLDWRRPAVELDRQVRAFVPWPVATASWQGEVLRVHEAVPVAGADGEAGTVIAIDATGITVGAAAGALRLLRVQAPGRGIVTAAEFARGASAKGFVAGARFDVVA